MNTASHICSRIISIAFFLLFLLVPMIFTPWNYELFEYNKMILVYGLTAVIGASFFIKMIADKKISLTKTPFDIPLVLFVCSQLISTLFSMDPHVSWFGYYSRFNGGMISVFSYVILFYAFLSIISTEQKSIIRFLRVALFAGFIVALYGIAEHFGIDKQWWIQDVQTRVFSTFGQPNWLAAYLVVLIPLAMGFLLWKIETRKSKLVMENGNWNVEKHKSLPLSLVTPSTIFYFLLTIIYFITILYTRSRSGLLAFAVADGIFWIGNAIKNYQKKQFQFAFLFTHILFFLIIFFNGTHIEQLDAWISMQGLQNRFTKQTATTQTTVTNMENAVPVGPALEVGGTDSGTIRKYVWEGAINAWKSSPKTILIGTGTETFAFAFFQYKPVAHNLTSEWDFLYNKAHNEFLNYLATTGLFGLGSYLFFIMTVIVWTIKQLLTKKEYDERTPLSIGLLSGWCSILVTNFFGFSVVMIQVFFFLIPALLYVINTEKIREYVRPIHLSKLWRRITTMGILGIGIILIVLLVKTWIADAKFANGYHLIRAGYVPQAYTAFVSAIQLNPDEPLYRDEFSSALASLSLSAGENGEATLASQLATASIKESDKALAISPMNVNFWKTRTKILYTIGSMDESAYTKAVEALEHARTLSPMDPKIYYNLGILYGRVNQLETAITALEEAKKLKKNYRDTYVALTVLYKEIGKPNLVKETAKEYIDSVDATDKEFLELSQ